MKQAETAAARNAVIYARYSSHNQTEQSIEGQLRVCHEYAQREGFTIVGEYIDRAISGKTDDRPDFQRMVADSRKRAFQYVIVYKLDRFARNRYDSAVYKHKLKQNGVKVVSAMENIGDNPESIILEAVLEASAEYYSLELAQKIKRGMRESALKGQFCGGGIPFGYKSAGGRLVIDEAKAPFVKKAFEQYAAGVPKKQIIEELNAAGLRNRNGKPFGNTALQVALQSEKYIGILRWNDIVIENGCPALIDRETFDKVQERIKQNKREGGKNKAKIEYLLTGKVFCGYCGGTVIGASGTGRHGDIHYYYCCRNRRLRKGCKKAHEKKDFLEWYVVEQTVLYVLTPQRMQEIAAAVVAQYDSEFNSGKVKELERQIAKLDRDIDKYTEMLLDAPKSARSRIYEKIEAADMQKADLEIDLSKLRIANKIRYTEAEIVAWLKLFCKGDLFDTEFRRRIIDTFINSVYLYDDRVIVFYNIRGGKQVSYIDMLDATEGFPGLDDEPAPADSGETPDAKKKPDTVSGVRLLNGMVAVTGFFMQEMYTRSGFEVMLDYNTYVWVAQLFIVGLVVGYLKDQLYTVQQESRDEIEYLEKRLADIAEINDSNVRMKQNFEAQLVNQKDSLGKIYDITSTLEQQAPEEVLFTAVRMLSRLMDCESAAVYTVANRNYARLFSSTSPEARSLGNSIEYTAMTEMYEELKERRVYINKTMEDKLPLMASAVYAEDSMQLIFMLWGLPWQRMTMAEANRLAVIGQMVQSAVVRANRYLEALSSQRYVEGTRLMAADAFRQLAGAFLRAQERGLTECVLLEVETGADCVEAANVLSGYTRQSDYMGSIRDGALLVLLSNTNSENAVFVMNRFRSAGYESRLVREAVW